MRKTSFKFKDYRLTLTRRIVQIIAFLLVNYFIIEFIFSINLLSFENIVKALPILNSPRNPLSKGAGFLEYIFFSIAEGIFPLFLIGVFLIILLFTNRWFCGWVCPVGAIQDICAAFPINKRSFKMETHKTLLKIKYVIIILLTIIIIPLGYSKSANILFYLRFKDQLGLFAQKPIGFFSLSEYLFVHLPEMIVDIFTTGTLPFTDFGGFIIFAFYLIIMILSFWYPRFYCRYFCPYAAVASVVADYSFLKLSRNPVKCVGRSDCGICEKECPKQIRILDEPFEFFTGKGECNLCLKCKEKCPYDAINLNFGNF